MHMGAMAVTGSMAPGNLVHIVINNRAHETVGGMPTVAGSINFVRIALGCGYKNAVSAETANALDRELKKAKAKNELSFIEVKSSPGARENLGRPTTSAGENKAGFMEYIR